MDCRRGLLIPIHPGIPCFCELTAFFQKQFGLKLKIISVSNFRERMKNEVKNQDLCKFFKIQDGGANQGIGYSID
jgi:hypothetical protein